MNYVNNSIAGAAVASPLWLPTLSDVSELAALLLPIVGFLWLVIQIGGYVYRLFTKEDDE